MKQDDFTLEEKLRGYQLILKTTYDLFSYKQLDAGTRLLIENLNIENNQQCLDLGCGYGSIGIVMAKLNPDGKVYMVDRDFIAVEYSKINSRLNSLSNTEALLSDGFSNLGQIKFDIIASNLPTHIAKEALMKIITDAKQHLNQNGKFYMVTTTKLKNYIQKLLEPVFKNCEIVAKNNNYTILKVEKS